MALINPTPIVEAVVRARTSFDGTDPSTRPRPRPPRPQWPVRQLMYNSRNNSQDSSTNEEDGTPPNIPPDNGNRDEVRTRPRLSPRSNWMLTSYKTADTSIAAATVDLTHDAPLTPPHLPRLLDPAQTKQTRRHRPRRFNRSHQPRTRRRH